jgi:arylsulfatase B
MDDSVGQIVKKLSEKNMLDNSIVLFFSDNGAQTVGLYQNSGSNWPLRGVKFTEFEGGVRVAAAIFSPLFKKRGYVNTDLIHLVDWLPTFYAIAGESTLLRNLLFQNICIQGETFMTWVK